MGRLWRIALFCLLSLSLKMPRDPNCSFSHANFRNIVIVDPFGKVPIGSHYKTVRNGGAQYGNQVHLDGGIH